MSNGDLYTQASNAMALGGHRQGVGALLAVVVAQRDGILSWNPEAANGKGGFKGGAKVVSTTLEACESELVADAAAFFTASKVSKLATVVRTFGVHLLTVSDDELWEAIDSFVRDNGGLTNLYARLLPVKDDSGPQTLAAIVANMYTIATCDKNGFAIEDIVAEVLAQAAR
jgi:hypothetical protein